MELIGLMPITDWLAMNAKLQQKKSAVRKELAKRGVLQKGSVNTFDHYKYFSESQYKELFTELFSGAGLELKFTELGYTTFEGTEKQANGRMPRLCFSLIDCETGFYEETEITGEGIDKGDKAGYKAYTGALKYYLANTFCVATGDDPEKDSPDAKMNAKTKSPELATKAERTIYMQYCAKLGVDSVETLKQIGWTGGTMTKEQYGKALVILKGIDDARQKNEQGQ